MSKKNKLFSLTVLASMLAMTGCTPLSASTKSGDSQKEITDAIPVDVDFFDKVVVYDGRPHGIEIEGTLPEGVSVTYSDNNLQTEVGDYEITAYFSDNKGTNYQPKKASLRIRDSSGSNEIWNNLRFQGNSTSFVYDGKEHSLAVDPNTIPEGYEVSRYTNNSAINVGDYEVTVYMRNKASKVEVYNKTTILKIVQADYDMSNVSFSDKQFAFDGKRHELAVEGLTDDIQVVVNYDNNGRTNTGSQTVKANFKSINKNYKDPAAMTATLTISEAGETVTINVFPYYNGNIVPVIGADGKLYQESDANYQGYPIKVPVGGTLDPNDLPVLAIKDENDKYVPAPRGAYSTNDGYDKSTVTEVSKQDTAIKLSVTYVAAQYSIVYQGLNSKDDTSRVSRYTFDQQLDLPTPEMNDGYEFEGWEYTTDYDASIDPHYKGQSIDRVKKYSSGEIGKNGHISSKTCVGNLVLKVKTHQIGADATIESQEVIYNGKQQDIEIKNKKSNYVYDLTYTSTNGIVEVSSPKNVGTYKVTLNVYKDATKKELVQPSQDAIFTIKKASLKDLGKNSSNQIGIANDSEYIAIKNSKGENVKAVLAAYSNDFSYDIDKNIFTATYDGNYKEVAVQIAEALNSNGIKVLKSNQSFSTIPFIPHITYTNLADNKTTNAAPKNAGTYEINVSFTDYNSDSSNFENIPSIKSTLIINKKNVDNDIQKLEEQLKNSDKAFWKDSDGNYAQKNSTPEFIFKYVEGKEFSVYFDTSESAGWPKGVAIDYYTGEKSSVPGTFTAKVFFKVTDSNIEVPSSRSVSYKITSNTSTVLFYDANNLSGNPIASYTVEKGSASPLPTTKGDETADLGYDIFYYMYDSYPQTETDATSFLSNVTNEELKIVIVKKPHKYNIKYVISDLADNSVNKDTYYSVTESGVLGKPVLGEARFIGWYLDPNFSTSLIPVGTKFNQILDKKEYRDLVLYAKFESMNPSVYFYLTEDSIGDDGVGSGNYFAQITNTFGQKYKLPSSTPKRDGREFLYWYITKDGKEVQVNETLSVDLSTDHAVFAKWKNVQYKLTVTYRLKSDDKNYLWDDKADTFDISYESLLTEAKNIKSGSNNGTLKQLINTITTSSNQMGYDFLGFYYTNGKQVDVDNDIFNYTNDQAISAQYKAKSYTINYHFINFRDSLGAKDDTSINSNFSSYKIAVSSTLKVTVDEILSFPSASLLNRDGYSLGGIGLFKYNADDPTKESGTISYSTTITQDSILTPLLLSKLINDGEINIVLEYFKQKYTITFIDEEGKILNGQGNRPSVANNGQQSVTYKEIATFPTISNLNNYAKYKGYEFECWEYNGGSYSGAITYEFPKDITVILKVKPKSVNVRFLSEGKEITDLSGVYKNSIGGSYVIPQTTPISSGRTFVGWVKKRIYDQKGSNKDLKYYYKTRNSTTNIPEKISAYEDSEFVTSVTPVEQADFDNDSFTLCAVFIDNEYTINIQYVAQSGDEEITYIKQADSKFIKTYSDNSLNNPKWDRYIYVKDNSGNFVPLEFDTKTNSNFIPNRDGYSINGLFLGTIKLFGLDGNKFKLSYTSTEDDYDPEHNNISWSSPMVLDVNYSAIKINAEVTTNIKTTEKEEKEVTRKYYNGDKIESKTAKVLVDVDKIKTATSTLSQTYGANLLLPNDPVLDGYTFKNWVRTDKDGNPYYIKSGNKLIEYTVNSDTVVNNKGIYDANGNAVTLPNDSTIYIKATYTKNAINFTFSGGGQNGERVSVLTSGEGLSNPEVEEFLKDNKYGYSYSGDSANGYTFKYLDGFSRSLVTTKLPQIPAKQGYNLGKWTITIDVDDSIYDSTLTTIVEKRTATKTVDFEKFGPEVLETETGITNVSVAITYIPKIVNILYYDDNDQQISTAQTNYSQSFTLPTMDDKEGKTFAGWRLVKLKRQGGTMIASEYTNTIIKSGSITLDNFNYISTDDNDTPTKYEDDNYYIRFDAVYIDKAYRVKFNIDNNKYIQDQAGSYKYSITNNTRLSDVFLGSENDDGIQLRLLKELGLDPTYFALAFKSQKEKSDGSEQTAFYCFTSLDSNNKYTEFSNSVTNINDINTVYNYSDFGSEFTVGIIYLENRFDKPLFDFNYDSDNKVATLTEIDGSNIASSNHIIKNKLWIPTYVLKGSDFDSSNIYQVTKIASGAFYNNGDGLEQISTTVESITIPDSIVTFEKGAFAHSLDNTTPLEIDAPKLTSISYLGATTKWVTKVDLADGSSHPLYLVNKNHFYDTTKNVQTLKMTFIDNNTTNLILPDVAQINKYSFINMSYLTSITVSKSIKTFGLDCFRVFDDRVIKTDDGQIEIERYVPNSVEDSKNFYIRQDNLEKVDYNNSIANWIGITFESKFSTPMALAKFKDNNRTLTPITKLNLNGQLVENLDATQFTSIKDYAFYGVGSLKSANLGNSMKALGKYAFSRTGIQSFVVTSSVINIEEGCFAYNEKMNSITLPSGIESISKNLLIQYKLDAGNDVESPRQFTITFSGPKNVFDKIPKSDDTNKTYYWAATLRYNNFIDGEDIDTNKAVNYIINYQNETDVAYSYNWINSMGTN